MARNKDFPKFSCMDDCIHLKACRRVQKIGRNLRLNVPRYCSEDCSAYESYSDQTLIRAVTIDDAANYIWSNSYLIREGYDEYDVYTTGDLDSFAFFCIPCNEDGEPI